ncbi:MAG: membrane protein insertion efficiency factor YidD [Alphaproteobacteria bacterium]|nr:membrane protein insertion efficiency factor YidD [Alphaproteobacteria bacterium]
MNSVGRQMRAAPRLVLRAIVRAYQLFVSPILGANCRFDPTCSAYADEAIQRFGAVQGSLLAVKRISRCHPWGGFGHDPVPERAPTQPVGHDA